MQDKSAPARPRRFRGLRTTLATGSTLVVMAGTITIAPGAVALAPYAAAAGHTTNHIYISYHGSPTYTWTVRYYDKNMNQLAKGSQTCVGGCKKWFSYSFDKNVYHAYVRIKGASLVWRTNDTTDGAGHDHCFLVRAGGDPFYSGDETTGCNGD